MHKGHLEMSESSLIFLQKQFGITNVKPCFEMPVTNADKGFLALDEFKVRLAQFAGLSTSTQTKEKEKCFCSKLFFVCYFSYLYIGTLICKQDEIIQE